MNMMQQHRYSGAITSTEVHKVLRNTYTLLGMTLAFSAVMAMISSRLDMPHPGMILTLVGYFGLLFFTSKFRNSALGLFGVFALTGFMGYTLGPIVNRYLSMPNGAEIVAMAMAGTATIFFALSAVALIKKTNFSFIGGFLTVGILVAFLAGLGALYFEIAALSLAVSAMFVLLMSGMILWQTSEIVHGGETNYIMATVSLFVSIFNLFTSLLQLLGFISSDD